MCITTPKQQQMTTQDDAIVVVIIQRLIKISRFPTELVCKRNNCKHTDNKHGT